MLIHIFTKGKIVFSLFIFMCMGVFLNVWAPRGAVPAKARGQHQIPLDLELQMVIIYHEGAGN